MVDQVEVVHVSTVVFDAQDFLHEVIHGSGNRRGQYLGDLAAQAQANAFPCRGLRVKLFHHVQDQPDDPLVRELLPDQLLDRPMRDAVKEGFQVTDQDVALGAVFPDVLL